MKVCRRCNREFDSPVPEITNPDNPNYEIACSEWCPACNALAMSVVFRESSAYRTKQLYDPMRTRREESASS